MHAQASVGAMLQVRLDVDGVGPGAKGMACVLAGRGRVNVMVP